MQRPFHHGFRVCVALKGDLRLSSLSAEDKQDFHGIGFSLVRLQADNIPERRP